MQWTADVAKALGICKDRGDKKAMKSMKKKQVIMDRLSQTCDLFSYNLLCRAFFIFLGTNLFLL